MRRAFMLLACCLAATAAGQEAPTVESLLKSAETKIAAGDATGALKDLDEARALLRRASAQSARDLASAAAKLGDVKATVAWLREAERRAPEVFPVDLAMWRRAVDASRKNGGSKEAALALVQAEVAAIRGKPFKADVESSDQSAEEFGAMVDASIEKEMPKATREDVHAGLKRLGFVPEGFDIKRDVTDALKSQAAAYYDPAKKKFFNLFKDMPVSIVETTAAHELVHALQDQYFDLEKWFERHGGARADKVRDDDKTLALRCVVEGEATFVQAIWQVEQMLHIKPPQSVMTARMSVPMMANMELDQLIAMSGQMIKAAPGSEMAKALEAMDTIEPYVLAPLIAAYMSGAAFVGSTSAGPDAWTAVDRLYEKPPASTEQCLHPEKYAKTPDLPTPVTTPELPEIAAAGWREADAAVHGELYWRVLLRRHGAEAKVARKAAAGWDGDLYRAWRNGKGKTAVALVTTWDTAGDAREFFDAYKAALPRKYDKIEPQPEAGAEPDRFFYLCGWPDLDLGALALAGREVVAVEGFDPVLCTTVLSKLLAHKIERVE